MEARTTFDSLIANIARVDGGDEHVARALIGQTFGSYRIVAPLGAGGMGWVFRAEHTVLGSRAAVKVLKPSHAQPHVVQRFFDEARAATRIADPGIVTVLDFGWTEGGAAYLVMELLAGQTLAQRVRGPMVPAQALAVVRQCAIVMGSAHARGIVHRDLKPDNIFIVPDPAVASERIKILDFGIAKLLEEGDASHAGTSTDMILGTPGYMSPEQCRGAGQVDHRTDIYALGCVLFFMLCGRPPFLASTPADLIADHLTAPPPPPSSFVATITPAIDELVARCLAKSADDRVQTMQELVTAIDQIVAPIATALAIGARPAVATAADPIGPPRRSRAWLAIAGGLAIGAAIAAIALTSGEDRPPDPAPKPIAAPSPSLDAGAIAPAVKQPDKPPAEKPAAAPKPARTVPRPRKAGSAAPPADSDDPFDRR